MGLLDLLFRRLIRTGSLGIIDHTGTRRDYGDSSPPRAVLRFADSATEWRVFMAPEYHLLQGYVDGSVTVDRGSLSDALDVCGVNLAATGLGLWQRLYGTLGSAFLLGERFNPMRAARKRVAYHYDLREDLFRLFLDSDMQYSCAYFRTPDMSLEEAQQAKKRHIAAKLLLADGQRILDIGCGWGGMALTLAQLAQVEILGVTLSKEQLGVARRRADAAGLSDRVHFELMDYRKIQGCFDRIVSVGMFEHVGRPHYGTFFDRLAHLLAADGVALLHSIGSTQGGVAHPWINRHIFPGAYTPSLGQVIPAAENAGLWITDVEILRLHYAETLKEWNRRFQANRSQAAQLYDERFCRMWGAYLQACEMSFRRLGMMVFQMQLAKDRHAAPLTRDYMTQPPSAPAPACGPMGANDAKTPASPWISPTMI